MLDFPCQEDGTCLALSTGVGAGRATRTYQDGSTWLQLRNLF